MKERRIPLEIDDEPGAPQPGTIAVRAPLEGDFPPDNIVPLEGVALQPGASLGRLFPDLDLRSLLTFLPDPKLKRGADHAAAEAMAVAVAGKGKEAVEKAEAALVLVRRCVEAIETGFSLPAKLANMLHKRLTGLRSDFRAAADEAITVKGREILLETQRLQREAEDARRRAQDEADAEERRRAAAALEQAKKEGAPKDVKAALKERTKTATAAPVASPIAAPVLRGTVAQNWKARFVGTPDGADPNPEPEDFTPRQHEQFRRLCRMVADGELKPVALAGVNWSYFNAQAKGERGTGGVPGLIEVVDVGSLRGPRR